MVFAPMFPSIGRVYLIQFLMSSVTALMSSPMTKEALIEKLRGQRSCFTSSLSGDLAAVGGNPRATRLVLELVDAYFELLLAAKGEWPSDLSTFSEFAYSLAFEFQAGLACFNVAENAGQLPVTVVAVTEEFSKQCQEC